MKILIVDSKSFGIFPLVQAMEQAGWQTEIIKTDIRGRRRIPELTEEMEEALNTKAYDAIFSFNYYVVIAEFCHQKGIPYISWVYDHPLVSLYSYTIIYDTNYVFLFDYAQYQELRKIGIKQVYYLPLASNTLEYFPNISEKKGDFQMDISFVGSLYNNAKNDLYAKFSQADEYTKGYLDALVDAQQKIYGQYILRDSLSIGILQELQRVCPYDEDNREGVEPASLVYEDYFLARKVTAKERQEALAYLAKKHKVHLFSDCKADENMGLIQAGRIDYYRQMPWVFRQSKINLNITLKSIQTGIPLRILDIMGAGGFLLTNYQSEMEEYFKSGVHYDYYGSMEELEEKAAYYLKHEELRMKIAEEGHTAVKRDFNYQVQLKKMMDLIKR